MSETIAEILAYSSTFSAIVPLLVGIFTYSRLTTFFRIILLAIFVSLAFDLFALLNSIFSWKLFAITNLFDICAIGIWGLAYSKLAQSITSSKKMYQWFWAFSFLLAIFTLFNYTSDDISNYLGANAYNFFQIVSSLFLLFLILKNTEIWELRNLLILFTLITCLVYFSLIVGVYAFFDQLDPKEMMKVFTIKWVSYILFNCALAIIIFYSRKLKVQ